MSGDKRQATPRNRLRWSALAAVTGVLLLGSGCKTLGPEYQEPEIPWLANWETSLYGQLESPEQEVATDLRFWWRLFDDPALNQLIAQLREHNPSMRIAGLRVLESRAQQGIAGSTLYPQVQRVDGSLALVNSQKFDGINLSGNQTLVNYDASFSLGWELDFWGRFRRAIESADAGFFANVANQQNLQVLLNAQLADLYFGYRVASERIEIAQQNAERQKRSLEITQQLFNSGQTSELDLQQANAQYLGTLAAIPALQIGQTQARNALASLLGRPPGEIPELLAADQELPQVEPLALDGIPARMLMRRPDVRAAAWQIAAQSAQIGVAEADFYPAISLFGSIGYAGNSLGHTANSLTLAAGPSVSWNIFDYGRIENSVRLQDARLQQLIEQYQDVVLQAARELDDAAIGVVKTAEQDDLLNQSLKSAERALELATNRYREGYADFQRVLDAQRSLAASADKELANRGSHISAAIAFYKALGGGWQETTIDQLIPQSVREQMKQRTDWGPLLDAPLPDASDRPESNPETTPDD